jgi:hypothetical protein
MGFDPGLADRLRTLVAGRRGVTEKAMFGGLAFMLDGKMFCGVLGNELLARVGPNAHDDAMARPHVRIMDFTGRPMRGYVFVGPEAIGSRSELAGWVDLCATHVTTLPEKAKRRRRPPARVPARSRAAAPGPSKAKAAARRRGAAARAGARRRARPRS